MILKLLALIYRVTGYYSNYAYKCRHRYLMSKLELIEIRYATQSGRIRYTLRNMINVEMNAWDQHYGFTKSFNLSKRNRNVVAIKKSKK